MDIQGKPNPYSLLPKPYTLHPTPYTVTERGGDGYTG